MREKKFIIHRKVWIYPGANPLHFIFVDGETKGEIQKYAPLTNRGFIPVVATIGNTTWKTSLFPFPRENSYLLCIKKSVRKVEGIFEGDGVRAGIKIQ